jgi:hypothetical protein
MGNENFDLESGERNNGRRPYLASMLVSNPFLSFVLEMYSLRQECTGYYFATFNILRV